MNSTSKPGKRIVSRSEYIRVQSRKTWLCVQGIIMSLAGLGVFCILVKGAHFGMSPAQLFAGFILLSAVVFANWYVEHKVDEIRAIEPVALLTRANADDLLFPDSLVRASEEPAQAQQAVLLRPSVEMQERCEEQLLRASAGE